MIDRNESLLRQRSRQAIVLLLLVGVAVLAASRAVHPLLAEWTARAGAVVQQHSLSGAAAFLVLSIVSAMLAFFSTAALIPIAVSAWGKLTTLLLLWIGWLLGGALSYSIGRYFGRSMVTRFIPDERLRSYEQQIGRLVGFPQILLLQIALPSEVPGYVLGTLRYRRKTYFAALAIAELPFAFGAVFLGESFLRGNVALLIILGLAGIAVTWSAAVLLQHRIAHQTP
jgi:uncharacterized membrane protein YdjX (TVP38/TMEM64 family)